MRLKLILISIFIAISAMESFGQHQSLLSQYLENALPSNPAFTGSRESMSIAASYRNQWIGLDGSPETQLITAHTPLKREAIGVGTSIFRESIGATSRIGFMASAAYRLKIDRRRTLSFGIAGGLIQQQGRWSKIATDEPGDVVFSGGDIRKVLPNVSAGVYYHSPRFFASYSLPFLLSYRYEESNISVKNVVKSYNHLLIVGGEWKLYHRWRFRPSLRGHFLLNGDFQADLNVLVHNPKLLGVGFSYRYKEAIVALVQMHINEQFMIMYSYDFGINDLNNYHVGTHELTLRFDLSFVSSAPSPKFF